MEHLEIVAVQGLGHIPSSLHNIGGSEPAHLQ